ncbi:MAG: hypothetical protein AAF331_05890 [Pseudomonadota bacterium]
MTAPSALLIDDLKTRYSEPQRHYHSWDHIEALLGHYHQIVDRLNDPVAVLWALYWHDAIYDPQASDNEDKSADLLNEMAPAELAGTSKQRADAIIRATKQHVIPDTLATEDRADMALFLDIDLSILAAPERVFKAYEDQIRQEYAFVPEPIYVQARNAILKGFLNRDRLYFSDYFHEQWTLQARENLQQSIEILDAKEREHG